MQVMRRKYCRAVPRTTGGCVPRMSATLRTFATSTRQATSTTTTRTTRAACLSAFATRYTRQSNLYGEINVFAKGAHDLSVRINKYHDVVDRTLLALPLIVVQRFNGRYYGQSELHDDKQVVRGNTSNEQQRTA